MASVDTWVRACLNHEGVDVLRAEDASGGSGAHVWECQIRFDGCQRNTILKVYAPGFDDYSKLGPVRTALRLAPPSNSVNDNVESRAPGAAQRSDGHSERRRQALRASPARPPN